MFIFHCSSLFSLICNSQNSNLFHTWQKHFYICLPLYFDKQIRSYLLQQFILYFGMKKCFYVAATLLF